MDFIRDNLCWRQLQESESSAYSVTVDKHHEIPGGVVYGEVLASIITSFLPINSLIQDLALLDNQVITKRLDIDAVSIVYSDTVSSLLLTVTLFQILKCVTVTNMDFVAAGDEGFPL